MVNEIEDDQVEEEPKNLRALQKALKYFNLQEAIDFTQALGPRGRDLS